MKEVRKHLFHLDGELSPRPPMRNKRRDKATVGPGPLKRHPHFVRCMPEEGLEFRGHLMSRWPCRCWDNGGSSANGKCFVHSFSKLRNFSDDLPQQLMNLS